MTTNSENKSGVLSTGNTKTLWSPKDDPHAPLIAAKGERYVKYREQWARTEKLELVTPMPTELDFELNPSCNMKCPMCTWSAVETFGTGRESWMPIEAYMRIIDEAAEKGVQAINLCYVNEPLIRKDIPEFVQYATERGIPEVMVNTNGMLLTEEMSRRLIEAGLTKLSVSVDAISEAVYDQIRVGGDFAKILGNIETFLRIRKEIGVDFPLLKITFLKNKLNEHELKDFVAHWKDRCELLSIQAPANPFDGEIGKEREERLGLPRLSDPSETFANIEFEAEVSSDKRCSMPFQRMTIRSDGETLPCCNFRAVDLVVGNAFEDDIETIWNNEDMQTLRQIHRDGQYYKNEICKRCLDNWSDEAPDVNSFISEN